MAESIEVEIIEYEERLKQAMVDSNLSELDELISEELVFTNHLGGVMTKADDLGAHQSGVLKISQMQLSDQKIFIRDKLVIVSVKAKITGSFSGVESENIFRFTRIWIKESDERWQVIAGHSCLVT